MGSYRIIRGSVGIVRGPSHWFGGPLDSLMEGTLDNVSECLVRDSKGKVMTGSVGIIKGSKGNREYQISQSRT